jgi:two-component system, LytTR family, response regulator
MSKRVAIIEDEQLAMDLIADYVEKLTDWEIVLTTMSAESAIPMLLMNKADVAFCDINLPGITGIELKEQVGDAVKIIYTTSYLEYVHDAYRQDAVDYLLKPISEDRFLLATQRYTNICEKVIFPPSPYMSPHQVQFTTDDGTYQCSADKILYVESYGGLSKVTFIDTDEIVLVKQDVHSIMQTLGAEHFVRTHRLFIANKYFVSGIMENFVNVGNYKIPLAATYVDDLARALG